MGTLAQLKSFCDKVAPQLPHVRSTGDVHALVTHIHHEFWRAVPNDEDHVFDLLRNDYRGNENFPRNPSDSEVLYFMSKRYPHLPPVSDGKGEAFAAWYNVALRLVTNAWTVHQLLKATKGTQDENGREAWARAGATMKFAEVPMGKDGKNDRLRAIDAGHSLEEMLLSRLGLSYTPRSTDDYKKGVFFNTEKILLLGTVANANNPLTVHGFFAGKVDWGRVSGPQLQTRTEQPYTLAIDNLHLSVPMPTLEKQTRFRIERFGWDPKQFPTTVVVSGMKDFFARYKDCLVEFDPASKK